MLNKLFEQKNKTHVEMLSTFVNNVNALMIIKVLQTAQSVTPFKSEKKCYLCFCVTFLITFVNNVNINTLKIKSVSPIGGELTKAITLPN